MSGGRRRRRRAQSTDGADAEIDGVSDDRLTESGAAFEAAPPAPRGVASTGDENTADRSAGAAMVIACGALAREILAVRAQLGDDRFALRCLPALLHNRPDQIPERVREAVRAARADGYEAIAVAYADCGTGGLLDVVCAEEGVERIAGPHCYAFFDGLDAFAARGDADLTSFYLTDFLARQFDALVWRGLGLDRHPDLRDMIFGHYERIVYLAQTDDPKLDAQAEAAAEKLGLAYERRFTGYGDLTRFIAGAAKRAPD